MLNTRIRFFHKTALLYLCIHLCIQEGYGARKPSSMAYTVSMDSAGTHKFQVSFKYSGVVKDSLDLKMPVWMPGYYQVLDYAAGVESFRAAGAGGREIKWAKTSGNTWRLYCRNAISITVSYQVLATRNFVASCYLDEERAFIAPTGLFMYVEGCLNHPVSLTVKPYHKWSRIATGLDMVAGKQNTFIAPDFDILYDSPILAGNLEELPSFTVRGVPHYFLAFKPGDFDRAAFMTDLKKAVQAAVDMMGDIPYKHYTFIAIGPGGGGIEHLNSAAISFNGNGMNDIKNRQRMISFVTHEYFHHYNVKRIRPVELGPFDYDKGSRTSMLWVAEGVTVYYEKMLLLRAGLIGEHDVLTSFSSDIKAYEQKQGRLFQSLAQSSYNTWNDGPFGQGNDNGAKTISYYDKGPVVALMLDFKIRNATANKKSLDDVMRLLYKHFYQQLKRGYTENEFKKTCEQVAGVPLDEFFEYIYTVKDLDYDKYLAYGGLRMESRTSPDTPFTISRIRDLTPLQASILKDWLHLP